MGNKELIYAVKQIKTALDHFLTSLENTPKGNQEEVSTEDLPTDKVLNERELAEQIGLSKWTIRHMRLVGKCPHIKVGSRIFFRLKTVLAWMKEQENKNSKQPEQQNQYGKIRRID